MENIFILFAGLISWLGITFGLALIHIAPEEYNYIKKYVNAFNITIILSFGIFLIFFDQLILGALSIGILLFFSFLKKQGLFLSYGFLAILISLKIFSSNELLLLLTTLFLFGLTKGTYLMNKKQAKQLEDSSTKKIFKHFLETMPLAIKESYLFPLILCLRYLFF